jgi:predicted ATP-grasp superfamily ATP-dependent carboligase
MDPAIGASSSCGERPGAAPMLLVGASARAAAQSARRGGLKPWAADLFCDRDLIEVCSGAVRIENYPHGVAQALAAAPPGPWLYTGALENHPELLDQIAAVRPLCGICGNALIAVRDPVRLADAVRAAGFMAPKCSLSPANVPTDGSWLAKPLASAGGHSIEPFEGHATRAAPTTAHQSRHRYYQERIDGIAASAVYIGDGTGATCLGATRQLIGLPWCGAARDGDGGFRYCGSVGPLDDVSPTGAKKFRELGAALARVFVMRGLFGIDVILEGDEVWAIEVNPRYTASVEILERALGISAVRLHIDAFFAQEETEKLVAYEQFASVRSHASKPPFPPVQSSKCVHGKAVIYAPQDLAVGESFLSWIEQQNREHLWPRVGDIPAIGLTIRARQPIVTVFAEGPDEQSALNGLQAIAADAYQNLAVSAG